MRVGASQISQLSSQHPTTTRGKRRSLSHESAEAVSLALRSSRMTLSLPLLLQHRLQLALSLRMALSLQLALSLQMM